jgi:hypothetical protein
MLEESKGLKTSGLVILLTLQVVAGHRILFLFLSLFNWKRKRKGKILGGQG